MTRTDEERAIVDEIRENPIKAIRNLFSEGGRLGNTLLGLRGVDNVPLIVEVEVSDRVYLTINAWVCDLRLYRQVTYEAYYATSSNGEMAWKLDSSGSCVEIAYSGLQRAVDGLALGDIINTPVIMQVSNNGHVRLSLLFWDVDIESYASYVDRARTAETETGGLVWGDYELARRPYTWQGHVEDFADAVAIGDATYEWANIQGQVNLCPTVPYYAWYFPLGPGKAQGSPGLVMYATNQTTK